MKIESSGQGITEGEWCSLTSLLFLCCLVQAQGSRPKAILYAGQEGCPKEGKTINAQQSTVQPSHVSATCHAMFDRISTFDGK
jgi:hypothetical protein